MNNTIALMPWLPLSRRVLLHVVQLDYIADAIISIVTKSTIFHISH